MLAIGCSGSGSTGPDDPNPPGAAPVATVAVNDVPAEMETGKSKLAGVTLKSAAGETLAGRTITWSSSNSDVAAVTLSGMVHANNPGTTTITATSEGKTGSATLKVDTRNGYLTAIVESVRAQYSLPAMGGAIVTRNGGMFGSAVSGRRRASQATAVTLTDLWHIGSNLKAITAHVAAIAVGEGKIT
jgi:CubicO group peptidase (beta-lactamase class C family)